MTQDDWQAFTATIKPLRHKKLKPETHPIKHHIAKEPPLIFPHKLLAPLIQNKAIKTKKNAIDAILDLHGNSILQAEKIFFRFVQKAAQLGNQQLLVITGKGKPDAKNTLRAALPEWVNQPEIRSLISRFSVAPPNLGGGGAYLIFLKK